MRYWAQVFVTLFLVALAMGTAGCLRPLSRLTPVGDGSNGASLGQAPAQRNAGVRNFHQLYTQLASGLGVPENNTAVQSVFADINLGTYQHSDESRSVAAEANRLRLVEAFCSAKYTQDKNSDPGSAIRGVFQGINLSGFEESQARQFISAATEVFWRQRANSTDEQTLYSAMADVFGSSGGGAQKAWTAGCVMVAGAEAAGEI